MISSPLWSINVLQDLCVYNNHSTFHHIPLYFMKCHSQQTPIIWHLTHLMAAGLKLSILWFINVIIQGKPKNCAYTLSSYKMSSYQPYSHNILMIQNSITRPVTPPSASKVLQRFLVQKLFLMNFEGIKGVERCPIPLLLVKSVGPNTLAFFSEIRQGMHLDLWSWIVVLIERQRWNLIGTLPTSM